MKLLLAYFIIVFLHFSAQAQFKCVSSVGQCENSNDEACRFVSEVWNKVKDKEDEWPKSLQVDFIGTEGVLYSSEEGLCRFRGDDGNKNAKITLRITKDTVVEKEYTVTHAACDQDEVFIENWYIIGNKMPPLVKEKLIFAWDRKFDLRPNEIYKKFTLESNVGEFSFNPQHPLRFRSFVANSVLNYSTQRLDAVEAAKEKSVDQIYSHLWLFDKDLFSQKIDITNEKTQMYFYSPVYNFYNSDHRDNLSLINGKSRCQKDLVNISFDRSLRILPTKISSIEQRLTYNDYVSKCLANESRHYKDELINILEGRMNRFFPKISEDNNINKNEKLEKEINELINFTEGGDIENSLVILRKLLVEVKQGQIIDER